MAWSTPYVTEDRLFSWQETAWISHPLESASWYRWLAAPTSRLFYVRETALTVRREAVKGKQEPYWYAYRKRHGRLAKVYLGRSAGLTAARLTAAAQHLDARQPPAL
jgi:LuxR family transcriptional regulator, maltose regulon positive regulatory protein